MLILDTYTFAYNRYEIKIAAIARTIDKAINRSSNTNVSINTFVHKGFAKKTFLLLIVFKIIVGILLLIVAFDANSYKSSVPLNNIIIKTEFNIYNYNYCCILHCVQFGSLLCKLIEVYRNYFLWCKGYFARTICFKNNLVTSMTWIKNEILHQSCYKLLSIIITMTQAKTILEKQRPRPQTSLVNSYLINEYYFTLNRKYFNTTIIVSDITVEILFAGSTGMHSGVSQRDIDIQLILKIIHHGSGGSKWAPYRETKNV